MVTGTTAPRPSLPWRSAHSTYFTATVMSPTAVPLSSGPDCGPYSDGSVPDCHSDTGTATPSDSPSHTRAASRASA